MTRHPRYKNVAKAEFAEWLFWLACCGCVVIVWDYCMDFDWPGLQPLASAPPLGTSKWDDAHLVLDSPRSCTQAASLRLLPRNQCFTFMSWSWRKIDKQKNDQKSNSHGVRTFCHHFLLFDVLPDVFLGTFQMCFRMTGWNSSQLVVEETSTASTAEVRHELLNPGSSSISERFQKEILVIITTGIIQMITRKLGRVTHTVTKGLCAFLFFLFSSRLQHLVIVGKKENKYKKV